MEERELSEFTNEQLLREKKKLKKTKIINATLVGFLVGIVIWSVAKNTWGLVTIIPLFFIYKQVNNSKKDKELRELSKEQNLD